MKPFLIFFASASLFLVVSIVYFGNDYLNIISVASQLIAIIVIGIWFNNEFVSDVETSDEYINVLDVIAYPFYCVKNIKSIKTNFAISIILFGTLALGIANAYLLVERLDIDNNTSNVIKAVSFTSLGITQFGGWFFQATLVYMLAVVLGGNLDFNIYLKLIGVSYVGFFILSFLTLLINYFYIPDSISPENFNLMIKNSMLHTIIGKMGEFWVLTIIGAGISYNENFRATKGLLTCVAPSCLLITFKYFFDSVL